MPHDEQWEAMCRGWEFKNSWRWDGTIEERERAVAGEQAKPKEDQREGT
jgi:hypothetical protein